ncbi:MULTISPECIES: hypothetical protein [unclassified Agarivorans]|uniref:hypothetical protein n=1 Tax=unclassified Agarivorans TaxID=2636026 RepID=UPI003D7CD4CB
MKEFLLQRFVQIDWSCNQGQLFAILLLALWLWAIWPAKAIEALLKDGNKQTKLLLVLTAMNGLWLLDGSVTEGIHVHFLGLVTLMLMYGWRMATVMAMLPTMFFATLMLKQPFDFAIYGLLAVALPTFLCFAVYSQVFKYLPHHLFVYIFCGAFLNAFLSIIFHILAWSVWLWLSKDYSWDFLNQNYLLIIPLLGFPEALLNGMAVTLMVVYCPHWLYDYSDNTYFER